MSEMVERVARAMYWRHVNPHRENVTLSVAVADWSDLPDERTSGRPTFCKRFWRSSARAAIEAMREPTEAMGEAAYNERKRQHEQNPASESSPCPGEPDGNEYWRVMIDAALKD